MKLYRVTQTITAMVVADAELDSALELGRYVLERDPDVRFLRLSLRGENLPDPPDQLRAFGVLR